MQVLDIHFRDSELQRQVKVHHQIKRAHSEDRQRNIYDRREVSSFKGHLDRLIVADFSGCGHSFC